MGNLMWIRRNTMAEVASHKRRATGYGGALGDNNCGDSQCVQFVQGISTEVISSPERRRT